MLLLNSSSTLFQLDVITMKVTNSLISANPFSSLQIKKKFNKLSQQTVTYFMTPRVIICMTFLLSFHSLIVVTAAGTPSPLSFIFLHSILLIIVTTAVACLSFPPSVLLFLIWLFVSFAIIITITVLSFSVSFISWLSSIVITEVVPFLLL